MDEWAPGLVVVKDHSWGLVGTTVLEVEHDGRRLLVKAGDGADHHLAREIDAHERWLDPWVATGGAPALLRADRAAKLLVRQWLPGRLVLGSPAADDERTYRQAGTLLAALHAQASVVDDEHEARENARTLRWLGARHRIADATVDHVRALVATWPDAPATLVPTHGDWQPRNWLVDSGVVRVIDFGRAAWRPAMTDLARLAGQEFARDPRLEAAFLEGYGRDPREPAAWHRVRLREAVATAAWAHQVGDEAFEAQGLRLLDQALAVF
ncbi:aminoglycoside phosphotransferase family protein [Cellulomonas sp. DKR-3]|uniref:Aminoglycoside phosphotransferase family protein n=1 Tax=Cellulomonas fulva TaxID=2835530 RepID=A0ABS5U1E8_9CELL|nr:aminoglycoside phosphotransferase family protein [Cellulomonas fulva]